MDYHKLLYLIETQRLLATFGKKFFRMQEVKLNYNTSYHCRRDGQAKSINKCIDNYLRCMIKDK